MNISRSEQRVLHVLAQGGRIQHHRDSRGRLVRVDCLTRDGFRLDSCDLVLFARLKRRRLIASRGGAAYLVTRRGLEAVRAQADNQ